MDAVYDGSNSNSTSSTSSGNSGGIWRSLNLTLRRWTHPRAALSWARRSDQWKRLLWEAATLIRLGCFDEARARLAPYLGAPIQDAAYLNLIGVIHESSQQWRRARKFYGRAMRADSRYAPAQQNMRRIYELNTFGRCREPVALGDETPGLWIAWLGSTADTAAQRQRHENERRSLLSHN